MARHGENIRKRKDGRWEGRYPVYRAEKGRRVYRSVYGKSYEEVREKLKLQKARGAAAESQGYDSQAAALCLSNAMLFTELADEWLEDVRNSRKPSTYVKYSLLYHSYLEKNFAGLTIAQTAAVLEGRRDGALFPDSIGPGVYGVVNRIFKYGRKRYSAAAPVIENPSPSSPPKPIVTLTQKEQEQLLAVLYQKMDIYKMAVLLCLYTGLRLGELCALKWLDLDPQHRLLSVRRSVQRIYVPGHRTKTFLFESNPKSEYSKREIPLSAHVLSQLFLLPHRGEYVFGGEKPLEPRTLQNHFKEILREGRLGNKNFHILRHTFATNCIEGGTDVKSLSEILGHADVQLTLNRYVHPSMDTKRRYLEDLALFYGQICDQAE